MRAHPTPPFATSCSPGRMALLHHYHLPGTLGYVYVHYVRWDSSVKAPPFNQKDNRLVAFRQVHDVSERLGCDKPIDIVFEKIKRPIPVARSATRRVRGDDDVLHRP